MARSHTTASRHARSSPWQLASPLVLMLAAPAVSAASQCVSLAGSKLCPAFSSASISTNLTNFYPFLSSVTDTQSFDQQLQQFVGNGYAMEKYQLLFGCSNFDPTNTTDLYARYTTSFLCNGIVQNSIQDCNLSNDQSRPLCADACSEFAISEQSIVSSQELCGNHASDVLNLLRADFTNCALPADAITGSCVTGASNEPNNCGYGSNLEGLCAYCNSTTADSTDSCCVVSDVQSRCRNVKLPVFSSLQPLFTTTVVAPSPTSSAAPSSSSGAANSASGSGGLTGGAIAGIVIGSILGAIIVALLLVYCCVIMRRRRLEQETGLNQPSPPHSGRGRVQSMTQQQPPFTVLPGARVTRMTALEGTGDSSPAEPEANELPTYQQSSSEVESSPGSDMAPGIMNGAVAAAARQRRKKSSSDSVNESNYSAGEYSTPEGFAGRPSEQMPLFKDYYSDDDIRPNDLVSTLWAYQPQAADEFELERGDMLRVVGIWDDGWATGIRVSDRADDWEPGTSNPSSKEESPAGGADLKAFPLVCVCLPQHWRKTLEGDVAMVGEQEQL